MTWLWNISPKDTSLNPVQGHVHVIPIVHQAVLSRLTWFSPVSVNQKTESALCADQWRLCRKCFSCFSHLMQPCGVCCLGELDSTGLWTEVVTGQRQFNPETSLLRQSSTNHVLTQPDFCTSHIHFLPLVLSESEQSRRLTASTLSLTWFHLWAWAGQTPALRSSPRLGRTVQVNRQSPVPAPSRWAPRRDK